MSTVVLTYDLHGASSAVYKKLDAELNTKGYRKALQDTVWEADYEITVSLSGALTTTKNEFSQSAAAAGATKYDLKIWGSESMGIATASKP